MKQRELGLILALLAAASSAGAGDASGPGAAGDTSQTPAAPAAEAEREAARLAFERGVSLAREGRYAEAKAAFLEAYAASPHHVVLCNVAEADAELGNTAAAIDSFERCLREGEVAPGSELERDVSARIAELRQRSASPAVVAPNAPAAPRAPNGAAAPLATAPAAGAAAALPAAPVPVPRALLPPLHTQRQSSEARAAVGYRWGLALGTSGLVLLGVAAGSYFWNDARHTRWQRERRVLDALPNRDLLLRSDPAIWHAAKANNDLLGSIRRVDVATAVAAAAGAVALGAGAWELLTRPTATGLSVAGLELSWRTRW